MIKDIHPNCKSISQGLGYLFQSLGRIFQGLGYLYQGLGYKITARENNFYGGGNKLLWRASATLVEPIVYRQFYP